MSIITYVLIGLYAFLTGLAGIVQWKETGFQIQTVLFVVISIIMLITLWFPNKSVMLMLLIIAFIVLHMLAIVEGLITNGRLQYSHHIIRFVFHLILVFLVYKFII